MRSSNGDGAGVVPGSARSGRNFRPLRGKAGFSRISQEGTRVRRGDVVVVVGPGEPGLPQVAFVAGRRVGNAVRRNRAKRRLRAAMERLRLAPDTMYLVIAGPGTADVEFRRLVAWLAEAVGSERGSDKERP